MLSRGAANIVESDRKLQDLERQLKHKLERARQVTSACSLEDPVDRTQEELISELEGIRQPQFEEGRNYAQDYWETYLQNEINCMLIRQAAEKKAALEKLIGQIEDLQDEHFRLNRLRNRKKNRRLAAEIEKTFLCPYDRCKRLYGSDVSLNLHIKLKHNGGNKTDREKLAEKICVAEENKEEPPNLTLNLPPGYLREYKKLYFQREEAEREGSGDLGGPSDNCSDEDEEDESS